MCGALLWKIDAQFRTCGDNSELSYLSMSFFNNIFFLSTFVCRYVRPPASTIRPLPIMGICGKLLHTLHISGAVIYWTSVAGSPSSPFVCMRIFHRTQFVDISIYICSIFVELEWREEISYWENLCHLSLSQKQTDRNDQPLQLLYRWNYKTFAKFLLMLIVEFIGIVGRKIPYLKLSKENSNS